MDFVFFNLAKKLKEKGFTLPKSEIIGKFDSDGLFHSQLYINYTDTMDLDEIIAPTISQVLKWLREEKKIHINIGIYPNGWKFYCCSCEKHNNGKFGDYDICEPLGLYNSYEAAAIAGIEYVLDNLI